MNRREFIRNLSYGSATAALGFSLPLNALAACAPVDIPRTMVNLMLNGGADLRFLFVPAPNHPSPDYVDKMWAARMALYPGGYPTYTDMFDAEYDLVTDPVSSLDFGIYNKCAWLRDEFEAGNVAVVANSFCSRNRRHDQSQLNANAGEPDFDDLNYDRDGWGGRWPTARPAGPRAGSDRAGPGGYDTPSPCSVAGSFRPDRSP